MRPLPAAALLLGVFGLGVVAERVGAPGRILRGSRQLASALRSRSSADPNLVAGPSRRSSTPEGLSLWVVDDSTKVFPGDLLGIPWDGPAVRLAGAGGETVAFQVVLAAPEKATGLDVVSDDFTSETASIPARRVEALLEAYIRCGEVEETMVSLGPGEYPDALLPLRERHSGAGIAAPFSLQPARNQPVWVDVRIPQGQSPGSYQGGLRVLREGQVVLRLAIELEVYPFEIPKRRSLVAWAPLYSGRLWKREGLDELGDRETAEIVWEYFRMAHEHRFDTQLKDSEPKYRFDLDGGKLLEIDWSRYDFLNGPALDGSLYEDGQPPRLWKVGGDHWWGFDGGQPDFGGDREVDDSLRPAHRRAVTEYAKAIAGHFEGKSWDQSRPFMYLVDEPDLESYPNYAKIIAEYGEALRDSGTGIGQLVTVTPYETEAPIPFVDIWATWGADYVPRLMAERQRLGEWAWFYHKHEPFVGSHHINVEGLGLRTWPWIAWRYRVDGIFLWAANFWNRDPYRDPENWGDNQLGNGVVFYPGALTTTLGLPAVRGPVSSFRMKALRRGLFDYEYFALLESLGGDPDPLVAKVMRSALNVDAVRPYWEHRLWARHGDWSHDPEDWDAVRREVATRIIGQLAR